MAIPHTQRVEPEWVSLREAARIYAVSTYTLRRRIATGHLRLTPVSGQVVVWSGGLLSRLVGLSGQVVLVL